MWEKKPHHTSIFYLECNSNQKWKKYVLAQKRAALFYDHG